MAAPCAWTLNTDCCAEFWATLSAQQKADATAVATQVIWAASGRQYGTCPVTVRPCGNEPCDDGIGGYTWDNGVFVPYIVGGQWYNCACLGVCRCSASCKVLLPGPVASVTSVTVDGVLIDPSTYRVDDGRWLVRTGTGNCWPTSQNFDVDSGTGTFIVVYERGVAVPDALKLAAGMYACEWGRGCVGASDCQLPSRIVTLTRQDVVYEFQDIDTLLESGLTGVPAIDVILKSVNPFGITHRYRVLSPELDGPVTTTIP